MWKKSTVLSYHLYEGNNIWEKAGYEIAFGQHMIKKPVSEYSCDKSVELVVGNGNILVRGENFKALFSRMNLGMVSYVYGASRCFQILFHCRISGEHLPTMIPEI